MKKTCLLKGLVSLVASATFSASAYAACTLSTPSTTINADCGPLVVSSSQTILDINARISGNPAVDQLAFDVTNFNVNTGGAIIGTSIDRYVEDVLLTVSDGASTKNSPAAAAASNPVERLHFAGPAHTN